MLKKRKKVVTNHNQSNRRYIDRPGQLMSTGCPLPTPAFFFFFFFFFFIYFKKNKIKFGLKKKKKKKKFKKVEIILSKMKAY
jgi:hypothetical protein